MMPGSEKMTVIPRAASQLPNQPVLPYTRIRPRPMMTGEMARGMSTSASSNQAPGKRWRARISETPTPNTVLSGTAIRATSSVSHSACSASGAVNASHAAPSPCWKARKNTVPDGQEDEHGQVGEHADTQRQAPAGALHTGLRDVEAPAQPSRWRSSTIRAMTTSSTETALAAGRSPLWERL